jgi:hypothetical protein
MLRYGTVCGKHWDVQYNIGNVVRKAGFTTDEGIVTKQASTTVVRCAGEIKESHHFLSFRTLGLHALSLAEVETVLVPSLLF